MSARTSWSGHRNRVVFFRSLTAAVSPRLRGKSHHRRLEETKHRQHHGGKESLYGTKFVTHHIRGSGRGNA